MFMQCKTSFRYHRGNQKPQIEERQTTQWSKEKGQQDKQRSTKHTHKTKDWATRPLIKHRGEYAFLSIRNSNTVTPVEHKDLLLTILMISSNKRIRCDIYNNI